MSKKRRNHNANKIPGNVKINAADIINKIQPVKADLEEVKQFVKEVAGFDDIDNKILVLRLKPIENNLLERIHKSLFAINEVLKAHNSTFIVLPDTNSIESVSLDEIDTVIKQLKSLKENKSE